MSPVKFKGYPLTDKASPAEVGSSQRLGWSLNNRKRNKRPSFVGAKQQKKHEARNS